MRSRGQAEKCAACQQTDTSICTTKLAFSPAQGQWLSTIRPTDQLADWLTCSLSISLSYARHTPLRCSIPLTSLLGSICSCSSRSTLHGAQWLTTVCRVTSHNAPRQSTQLSDLRDLPDVSSALTAATRCTELLYAPHADVPCHIFIEVDIDSVDVDVAYITCSPNSELCFL